MIIVTPPALIEGLVKSGKIVVGSQFSFARVGMSIQMRAGVPKPDISSVEAFKQAMLNAKAIACLKEGLPGSHFIQVVEKLGIGEQMKPKLRPMGVGEAARSVAKGEADYSLGLLNQPPISGTMLLEPYPAELQAYVTFATGLAARATDPQSARKLLAFFFAKSDAVRLLKSLGMEPIMP